VREIAACGLLVLCSEKRTLYGVRFFYDTVRKEPIMNPCLKAQICLTERWLRRRAGRLPSGSPAPLSAPVALLVAYQTKRTLIDGPSGSQLVESDLLIADVEICRDDRIYTSLADAIADIPVHIVKEARSFPDLSCGAALNAIDHYEAIV